MKHTLILIALLVATVSVQAQQKPIKFKPVPHPNSGGTTYVSVNLKLYKVLKKVK